MTNIFVLSLKYGSCIELKEGFFLEIIKSVLGYDAA